MVPDGLFPAVNVAPVEQQGGRCGLSAEVEVFCVQGKVRGGLEAAEKACGPSRTVVEGAAHEVTAAVMEKIGRVFLPACNVGDGDGVHVGHAL